MSRKAWEELAWQLTRLPGGAAAAIPDFFAPHLAALPDPDARRWELPDATALHLSASGHLAYGEAHIAVLPEALLAVAAETGNSPILMGLLAIAGGELEGCRTLKTVLPRIDGAAKDLMLMTVCRLCG